jgi:transposase
MYVYKQPVAGKPEYFRIQICISERVGKQVKRRVLRHFGIAKTPYEVESIMKFARSEIDRELSRYKDTELLFDASENLYAAPLLERAKRKKQENPKEEKFPSLKDISEEARYIEGIQDIYGKMYDDILSGTLPPKENEILKQVVLTRVETPASKRKTCEILEREMGFSTSLSSIYRMMDVLEEKLGDIQRDIFNKTRSIFNKNIEMMFFDVSTLYFESFDEDDLRKFGYSKDQKYHVTQVVLALATTAEGLPLGYKLFPGNTEETKTLLSCLDEWNQILKIDRVFLVADSAMCSFPNLFALQERGIEFVVASRMKQLCSNVKNDILNQDGYKAAQIQSGESIIWFKEIEHKMEQKVDKKNLSIKGRLIATYSSSRAAKDKYDRDKIIEKLKSKIKTKNDSAKNFSPKKLISNSGYVKYTQVSHEKNASLNEEKIAQDAQWDGMHGLFTNSDKPVAEIFAVYRRLYIIEESFRINKNDLSMRPIYHFKSKRIQAHIGICFIAFALIRHLQFQLEKNGHRFSPERIRTELGLVQFSIFKDKQGQKYKMPSKMSDIAQSIYDCIGIKRKMTVSKL